MELGNKEINPTFKGKFFNELTPDEQQLFMNYGRQNNNANQTTDQGQTN
jgi:hypothetical protein